MENKDLLTQIDLLNQTIIDLKIQNDNLKSQLNYDNLYYKQHEHVIEQEIDSSAIIRTDLLQQIDFHRNKIENLQTQMKKCFDKRKIIIQHVFDRILPRLPGELEFVLHLNGNERNPHTFYENNTDLIIEINNTKTNKIDKFYLTEENYYSSGRRIYYGKKLDKKTLSSIMENMLSFIN